ncbi:hypothetical protein C3L33_19340, partial [Rhododendron williamsianum]
MGPMPQVSRSAFNQRWLRGSSSQAAYLGLFIELSGGIHGGADPPAFQIAERERLAEASSEKVTDSSCILKPHRHESSDEHISEVAKSACASSVEDQATIGDDADIFQKSNDTNSIADEPDRLSDIDDDEVMIVSAAAFKDLSGASDEMHSAQELAAVAKSRE